MRGFPQSMNEQKINLENNRNDKNIYLKWKKEMQQNVNIVVCATCGVKDVWVKDEFVKKHYSNVLFNIFKVNENIFNEYSTTRKNAMHIHEFDGQKYHFASKGVINDEVIVCQICWKSFNYAKYKSKPPINTFAKYDLGNVYNLPKLSYAEKIAISKAIIFVPIIHYRTTNIIQSKGIKGHAFGMKQSKNEILESFVHKLPRTDLNKWMQIVIIGIDEGIHIAKQIIRQGSLQLKLENILKWLTFLKAVNNPFYADVKIPMTVKEKDEVKEQLQQCVDDMLDNIPVSNSRIVDEMVKRNRSNLSDSQDKLMENLDGLLIEGVFLGKQGDLEEPMNRILQKLEKQIVNNRENIILNEGKQDNYNDSSNVKLIKDDIKKAIDLENKNEQKINKQQLNVHNDGLINAKVIIDNELFDEYENNYKMLSCAYPYIFPFGLTKKLFTGTVPSKLQRTWSLFYDHRVAQELNLLFLLFDQTKRHAVNSAVSFRINRNEEREREFVELCNQDDFLSKLKRANNKPNSKESINLKKKIQPLIKIIGQKVPWSIEERGDSLGKLYAMMHFFNVASHFITISPCMRHNGLALRIACGKSETSVQKMNIYLRSKLMTENPVAASHISYRLVNKFFEIIVGLPLNHFTGKKPKLNV